MAEETSRSGKTAREIAAEWHGGQFSELYKFSSSGLCDDAALLQQEINGCFRDIPLFQEDERPELAYDLTHLRRTTLEIFGNYDDPIVAHDNVDEVGHA